MPPEISTAETSPFWAALTVIGLGIFAVVLVKEAYDAGHGQGWW